MITRSLTPGVLRHRSSGVGDCDQVRLSIACGLIYHGWMEREENDDSGDRLLAESLGRCVARHREAEGISQSELARRAGLARAYVWRVENGQTIANMRSIGRISLALNVPVPQLLEGVDVSGLALKNRPYGGS
ncbi:helix-turn-helix domain-containing protein [Qipengyuania sp. GH1]|uniref:helix-turn-helix domain-containing protein n=1 Tax=Qipengyuania aestuarii TaxID=2867241 RepID=UPI001C867771|nr:helix-turn-helix domain-containing protein [Qipengyuania aestuarii]